MNFSLPGNSSDPQVVAALQTVFLSALTEALSTTQGVHRTPNITVTSAFSIAPDGSVKVSMAGRMTFSANVDYTSTMATSLYEVDPVGSLDAATKAASSSSLATRAAADLALTATHAAVITESFANGTLLTGAPSSSISSRLAAAASAALAALGKYGAASLVNSTSLALAADARLGPSSADITTRVVSDNAAPVGNGVGIAAPVSTAPGLLTDGLASGAAFGLVTISLIFVYVRRYMNPTLTPNRGGDAVNDVNPLFKHSRPAPPRGKPPKHSYLSFQQHPR